MSLTGLLLAVIGAILVVIGVARARGPWGRYRALKSQEENIARYEAWRGGLRDTGPTGASVAMDMLRSRVRRDAAIAGAGIVAVLIGLFLK
jgi:hypothetical protein